MFHRRGLATARTSLLAFFVVLGCAAQQVCKDAQGVKYVSGENDLEPNAECVTTGNTPTAVEATSNAAATAADSRRCNAPSSCKQGEHCNTKTGWCETMVCGPLVPCPGGFRCDPQTSTCR